MQKLIILLVVSILFSSCQPVIYPQVRNSQDQSSQMEPSLHYLPIDLGETINVDKNLLLNEESAIRFSYQLLPEFEHGEPYQGTGYLEVEFPRGEKGIFVSLGFVGIVRGYQFLYKLDDKGGQLIDFRQSQVNWGIYSLETSTPTKVEAVNIFTNNKNDAYGTIVKVTGARHDGTGLFANGVFELIHTTDEGLDLLFSDLEENLVASTGDSGIHESYDYKFKDIDGDNIQEIAKEGKKCKVMLGNDGKFVDTNCEAVDIIFGYIDGQYKPR